MYKFYFIWLSKLGTVKEEEDCLNDNINNLDLNYVDDVHYDDIQLTEGTIRTLLEQAKQEGIVSDGSFTKEEGNIEDHLILLINLFGLFYRRN